MKNIRDFYVGLMSGTSMDGVDGVLVALPILETGIEILSAAYVPFSSDLRAELMGLQSSGTDEIHREAMVANTLAHCYAACVEQLLHQAPISSDQVAALGVHGQTIRHRPEQGYSRQVNNPALLAELTRINVIADFRSRDIAAGGQGAPLVPAFHQAVFGRSDEVRVVVNIGGFSNVTILDRDRQVMGFDTGPGNVLMDGWVAQHKGQPYDKDGYWAASGKVSSELLALLCEDSFILRSPPKSTGRDSFHNAWLAEQLARCTPVLPEDVQATLVEFTAVTIVDSIVRYAPSAQTVYVCGGGAYNGFLMRRLKQLAQNQMNSIEVATTAQLGVEPCHVEALAFAWLAHCFDRRSPANVPAVTGAQGVRVLGALYPA